MRVLLADDHKMILEGLQAVLTSRFPDYTFHRAINYEELMHSLRTKHIDILIQDIRFGMDDARDFIESIKKDYTSLKIIIVSSISDASAIKKTIKSGVSAYIIKSESTDYISDAITAVQSGTIYLSPQSKALVESLTKESTTIVLSNREKEVLAELLKEKTTKEIAEALFISDKTVEMHKGNLFVKLDVKNSLGLVKKALQLNLLDF